MKKHSDLAFRFRKKKKKRKEKKREMEERIVYTEVY